MPHYYNYVYSLSITLNGITKSSALILDKMEGSYMKIKPGASVEAVKGTRAHNFGLERICLKI